MWVKKADWDTLWHKIDARTREIHDLENRIDAQACEIHDLKRGLAILANIHNAEYVNGCMLEKEPERPPRDRLKKHP